ncbi:O-antigen ligase family protein [Campylobacter geochelonis]|uniref:O-antigen ligase family protein n=1 Tax=Campylobacter geochelonis TaxID=1780362 RepID=UPI0007708031|nr:O-antigen ligase family protein [Campylobacter geochelonis]CZE48778.1 O-antigen polymerase family protein [Campylobacter geochelonis]CZE51354.1 O-antigen polymerase family protein [Campylobacter geochelonis]
MNLAVLNLKNYLAKKSWQECLFIFFVAVWIMSLPFKNAVYQISQPLIILYFLIYIFITKNYKPLLKNLEKTRHLALGFGLLFLSMIVANFLNPELLDKKSWHITLMFLVRYAMMFVMLAYFYTLGFFSKKEIIAAVFASFFLLTFTAIYQILGDVNVLFDIKEGLTGSLTNRNATGLMMGLAVTSSIVLFSYSRKLSPVFMIYFIFFMIFSFSRSAWVASFTAGVCFVVLNFKSFDKKDKRALLIYIIVILLFLSIFWFGFDSLKTRLNELLEGNSSNRYLIWKYSWSMFLQNPLFGYGVDTFRNLPDSVVKFDGHFNSTHNMPLEILLYTGIFGFLASFFTIFLIFKQLCKNLVLLPVGVHFLVATQFDYGAYSSKELLSYLTILVFLAYADEFRKKTL